MQRQIKFRAWDKQNKVMIPVDGINFNSLGFQDFRDASIASYSEETGKISCIRLSEVELIQYTGMKDKNGKEIYEGDIFHLGDKNIKYQVVWNDTGFMGKQCGSSSYVGLEYWQERIEVIGDIWTTPELLEE